MEKKSMRKQMTDVEKSIHEESEKISSVKKIVKARSAAIEQTQFVPEELSNDKWKNLEFSNPDATIRIGTVFSGIGAIEHAFQRLKLNHKIVFAGDIEENCRKSYFANYDIKEEDWFTDIREFDASKYKGNVDFVIGGALSGATDPSAMAGRCHRHSFGGFSVRSLFIIKTRCLKCVFAFEAPFCLNVWISSSFSWLLPRRRWRLRWLLRPQRKWQ
jgi:hypothetical protein